MLLSIQGEEAVGKTTLAYTAPTPSVGFQFDLGSDRAILGTKYQELFEGKKIQTISYEAGKPKVQWAGYDITVYELPTPVQLLGIRIQGAADVWSYFIQLIAKALTDAYIASIIIDTMTIARRVKADAHLESLQDKAFNQDGTRKQGVELREQLLQIEWGRPNDSCRDIYCVGVDTPILASDLRWRAASDLRTGDPILAFDEQVAWPASKRRFRAAAVTNNDPIKVRGYRIQLGNGAAIDATPEHMWLVDKGSAGGYAPLVWRSTERLYQLRDDPRRDCLMSLRQITPYEPFCSTYDDGVPAGAFDGEGSLISPNKSRDGTRGLRLVFAQKDNSFLSAIREKLATGYFHTSELVHKTHDTHYLSVLGGVSECMRFLMRTRPTRLMDKWEDLLEDGGPFLPPMENVEICSIEPTECWVSRMSSSAGTYIAHGFGAHNTATAGSRKNLAAVHHLTDERVEMVDGKGQVIQRMSGKRILDGLSQTHRFVDVAVLCTKGNEHKIACKVLKCGYILDLEGTELANPTWQSLVNMVRMRVGDRMRI